VRDGRERHRQIDDHPKLAAGSSEPDQGSGRCVGGLPLRQRSNMRLDFLSIFSLHFSYPPVYPPGGLKISNGFSLNALGTYAVFPSDKGLASGLCCPVQDTRAGKHVAENPIRSSSCEARRRQRKKTKIARLERMSPSVFMQLSRKGRPQLVD
jgi:hypothetical protein